MNRSRSWVALGIILCLLLSSLIPFILPGTARAQPADSPWPMFGQNQQRTGQSPYTGPETPEVKWSFTTGNEFGSSPAIGTDGTIYIGSLNGRLYALNTDGGQKWSLTTGNWVWSSPAIGADGTIYVGSLDNNFYALNSDGSEKWRFTTVHGVASSPAIGADGTIYVGARDRNLYALNPDGSQKWRFTTGNYVESSPSIGADGTIYVGSNDRNLYALNPDGSEKWRFTTGDFVISSPAIGTDGTIYVGSRDNNLYAINPDGSQKWSFTTGSSVYSSPAIGADGTIYVGSYDNKLYAINPDGSQKWSFTTGDSVYSSPAIGADGTIYVGSLDNRLYAINPDGSQKWSFTTGHYVYSSPAIGADGTIYLGSKDGKLYAVAAEYDLTISGTAGGSVTAPGEGTFTYDQGTVVNLVATPDSGYRFVNWTGDVDTIANVDATTTTITMHGNYAITANFEVMPDQYDITISSTTGGSVTAPGEGTFTYDAGAVVDLVATADSGYRFVNWTGDVGTIADVNATTTTITMHGNYAITANFELMPDQYDLTISSTTGGSVTAPGEGTFTYDAGAVVDLAATADSGYRFVNWAGDVGTIALIFAPETTITMDGDYSITAHFTEVVASKTEEVTDGTLDAREEADTTVIVSGTATVTVARYADNPGGDPPVDCLALDKYIDVYVPDTGDATGIEIRLYYTNAELAAAAVDEESLRLHWWDGAAWIQCSESGVTTDETNGYRGYMWVKITADTVPSLLDLEGTPFGGYCWLSEPPHPPCLIATAAYGTPMAEEIQALRDFRDGYLLTSSPGRAFVDFYYRTSPPVARFIADHPGLKPMARTALWPAVAMSTVVVNTTPAEKMAPVGLLVLASVALAIRATRRRRDPSYA